MTKKKDEPGSEPIENNDEIRGLGPIPPLSPLPPGTSQNPDPRDATWKEWAIVVGIGVLLILMAILFWYWLR